MEPTCKCRSVVDIGESVRKHSLIMPFILQAHALSGCDSVCRMHGIGKPTVIKAMHKKPLTLLGNPDAKIDDVVQEATEFIGICYNTNGTDMSSKRHNAWIKKSSGKLSSAPKLCSLPPTTEAFEQNVLRAHYQCMIWKTSLQEDPPDKDPTKYGWKKNEQEGTLAPIMIPEGVKAIPQEVLKIFACTCSADEACAKGNCSCRKHQISCTFYSKCYQTKCYSAWTQSDDAQTDFDIDLHEEEEH